MSTDAPQTPESKKRIFPEEFQTPEGHFRSIDSPITPQPKRLRCDEEDFDIDSSDEEDDSEEPLSHRYIACFTASISPSIREDPFVRKKDYALSLISHDMAIKILHAPSVTDRYQILAEEKFLKSKDLYVCKASNRGKVTIAKPVFDLTNPKEKGFVVEFLANIRLHNRDERNHLKNKEDCIDSKWVIASSKVKEKGIVKLENLSRHNKKGLRSEIVDYGTGKNERYEDIFEYIGFDDMKILLEARLNIQDRVEELASNKTLSLWYMLFGCEFIKSPAALLHNNMVLDLAKASYDKYCKLEVDYREMPMSKKGAIEMARHVNELFCQFIKKDYRYDRKTVEITKAPEMVLAEADLLKKWLRMKIGEERANPLLENVHIKDFAKEEIIKVIRESYEEWGLKSEYFIEHLIEEERVREYESDLFANPYDDVVQNPSSKIHIKNFIEKHYKGPEDMEYICDILGYGTMDCDLFIQNFQEVMKEMGKWDDIYEDIL